MVLYPKGMVSKFQELQLKSSTQDNVHLYQVEGTSDDLDIPIAKCFPDPRLTSINSINWARILIQVSLSNLSI
jgi:threonine synthase